MTMNIVATERISRFAMAYAEQGGDDEFVIPEDLSILSDEELASLHSEATSYFDALYGDGTADLSQEEIQTLTGLTDGIEALAAETAKRGEAAEERAAAAAELAARVRPGYAAQQASDGAEDLPAEAEAESVEVETEEQVAAELIAAADARKSGIRVPLSNIRARQGQLVQRPTSRQALAASRVSEALMVADVPGFKAGSGIDWLSAGKAFDRRLGAYNNSAYERAAAVRRHLTERLPIAMIRKAFDADLVIKSDEPGHVDEVMRRAVDQSRLPGGSLIASGGWCAPSEVLYDLLELESRDGLLSLPEVNISRGGIRWALGPQFQDIYGQVGFCFTEEDDINGTFQPGDNPGDPNVVGPKPCFHVPCPDFTEARLDVCGLCITAGLLQQRGYPEVLARTLRGALIAHDHKMSATLIQSMVSQSTAVSIPSPQAGALAPILTAIELQVEHYKYTFRLARNTTLEAIFPYWVRGAIRSDLSRRLSGGGDDLISVSDAQIDAWFAQRGIAPQFVYDWQPLDPTAADDFTQWPTEVSFLLYAAGTFVRGSADVITVDTLYDSVQLGQNEFTALFTEEGWLVAKRGADSRVVTVPICPDGATHGGIDIACDGTEAGDEGEGGSTPTSSTVGTAQVGTATTTATGTTGTSGTAQPAQATV